MIVSNFCIENTDGHQDLERRTRYHLQITNLEEATLQILVEFHLSALRKESARVSPAVHISADPPAIAATMRTTVVPTGDKLRAETRLILPPRTSVVITLESGIYDGQQTKGFVVLRVPAVRHSDLHRWAPQFAHAVKVLLHARREDEFRPGKSTRVHGSPWELFFNAKPKYSSESIALASGRAENEIEPEGRIRLFEVGDVTKFGAALSSGNVDLETFHGANSVPEDERVLVLVDLLHGLYESDSEVEAMNDLLSGSGSELRLTRAGPRRKS